jgi:AcrR family transcriptional regulator
MSSTRRTPTQARSRRTVQRILDAAEAIVGESGADAATTRAIAARAGVSAPSLYRFFADRDEILDRLLSTGLAALDRHAEELEATWEVTSIRDVVTRALDLHVDYYEAHPAFVRLWFGGRISPGVVTEVHARNRALAGRLRATARAAGLIGPQVPESAFVLVVELGDRILDLAFRDRRRADREALEHGREALVAYLERLAAGP